MTITPTAHTLAATLARAGLGGLDPLRAARALLLALARQPGGDPDHQAAHGALILMAARSMPLASIQAMLAEAPPERAMMTLARLAAAGATEDELTRYLPDAAGRRAA